MWDEEARKVRGERGGGSRSQEGGGSAKLANITRKATCAIKRRGRGKTVVIVWGGGGSRSGGGGGAVTLAGGEGLWCA
jgi:hypothetical protein